MTVINSKICILGDFAVGKTSTVERFVNNAYSDKYLSTIGVKVDTKEITLDGVDNKLVIWDVAGTDKFGAMELAYLRGASGYILVVDGTRSKTMDSADHLRQQLENKYGELPYVLLINKCDLRHNWEITDTHLQSIQASHNDVFVTSAKSGQDVEEAIHRLAQLISEREI